ncbi:hypothetical protein SAMN04487777_11728 [Priestia aryabhattai B8W22]|uniref:hypothetical protein n=1 Tax=Priestia aryabhattai TaxID=412384 RepID=UPI000880FC1E|nr:hypothetical protein [Priestia aryabhattai]MCM3773996.1 hypothetical protein [Priestia aryabhattai]SDE59046.1 hypothetical protein SAMN04487777_11728 [Priestia aryabhattai B8W22]
MVYLMDLERSIYSGMVTYWKANKSGYTTNLQRAGLYPPEEAKEIAENDFDKRTVIVDEEVVKRIRGDLRGALTTKSVLNDFEALNKREDE